MLRKVALFALLMVAVCLSGCAVDTNVNRYALNNLCIRQPCCGSCFTVFVAETTAAAGYDSDQIIYLKCPYELKSFSRNRWVAPPNEMLTSLVAQSLRNTCCFKAVTTAPYVGQSQYRIETKLLKLQHEFFCCPSQVRMVIQVVIIENCCREVVAEKVCEIVLPAPRNNPYGGVIAANHATSMLLNEIAHFVICSIQRCPSLPPPKIAWKEKL
jgi:cholesterol transport system auxiliary component